MKIKTHKIKQYKHRFKNVALKVEEVREDYKSGPISTQSKNLVSLVKEAASDCSDCQNNEMIA